MYNFFLTIFLALNFLFIIGSLAVIHEKLKCIVSFIEAQIKFNEEQQFVNNKLIDSVGILMDEVRKPKRSTKKATTAKEEKLS